ncbi:MAG: response regulator [Rubrivivax sp.]
MDVAHVAAALLRLDDGTVVAANAAFCRLVQRPAGRVVGQDVASLPLWPDAAARERLFERLRASGQVSGIELRPPVGADAPLRLQLSAGVVRHRGAPHALSLLTDLSGQDELLTDLRTAHERLGVALRASGVVVFSQDAALRYTWVANPALGVTEADVLGRTDEELMGVQAAAPLVAVKRRVLASGRAERGDVWVANNGQLACYDLVVEPERDGAGRVSGIVCAALDITARMTAQPLQPPAAPAAASAPTLRAIQGMASLLQHEPLSPRQAQRLQRIGQAVRQLGGALAAADAVSPLQRLRLAHAGTAVLVVEQNEVLRELLEALLQDAGLQVIAAATGVEAFRLALEQPVRLLLLDMELPQRGGVAAARALRATLRRPLPIVAMVTPGSGGESTRALDADLDDVIDRPVAAEPLYRTVLSWLEFT